MKKKPNGKTVYNSTRRLSNLYNSPTLRRRLQRLLYHIRLLFSSIRLIRAYYFTKFYTVKNLDNISPENKNICYTFNRGPSLSNCFAYIIFCSIVYVQFSAGVCMILHSTCYFNHKSTSGCSI